MFEAIHVESVRLARLVGHTELRNAATGGAIFRVALPAHLDVAGPA